LALALALAMASALASRRPFLVWRFLAVPRACLGPPAPDHPCRNLSIFNLSIACLYLRI
jgi:hypothetical protein